MTRYIVIAFLLLLMSCTYNRYYLVIGNKDVSVSGIKVPKTIDASPTLDLDLVP